MFFWLIAWILLIVRTSVLITERCFHIGGYDKNYDLANCRARGARVRDASNGGRMRAPVPRRNL